MHQPWYLEPDSDCFIMPWTRLHALKDYYDMPLILSKQPGMKATFNLVPSLLEQIRLYSEQGYTDTFLTAFLTDPNLMSDSEKEFLINNFFSANSEHQIGISPRYRELFDRKSKGSKAKDFSDSDLFDLQIHFELAWFGESMKDKKEVKRLIRQDSKYTQADKDLIIDLEKKRLSEITSIYKKILESGQAELSVTPFYHPILPLLCDIKNVVRSDDQSPMPSEPFFYPKDASLHIKRATEYFEKIFGTKPSGMWPSEGSVSEEIIPLIALEGIKWIATDEEILFRSSGRESCLFRPYSLKRKKNDLSVFFRDHTLSDKIGFVYSKWSPQDAVADFLSSVRHIASTIKDDGKPHVISIILDGENAWEYYPENGKKFLSLLYKALSEAPDIVPVTFSEYLKISSSNEIIKELKPGSWIGGNFRTWSGDPVKNRAWDLLSKTRAILESKLDTLDPKIKEKAIEHIMIAEGSDWFWWFGEGNYTSYLELFDRLFRSHLKEVLKLVNSNEIPELDTGVDTENKGLLPVRSPKSLISPRIDGINTSYYEWMDAGLFKPSSSRGAMQGNLETRIRALHYGFDMDYLYLRIDMDQESINLLKYGDLSLFLNILSPLEMKIPIDTDTGSNVTGTQAGFGEFIELAVPLMLISDKTGIDVCLSLSLEDGSALIEAMPAEGCYSINLPDEFFELDNWYI